MPRERNPNRDKAFEIFKQHNGDIENRRIAEQLDEDEKKIAVWKQRDKWVEQLKKNSVVQQSSNVVQQTDENYTTKPYKKKSSSKSNKKSGVKKSAQPPKAKTNTDKKYAALIGNQNAAGNRGGKGGPIRNKHALKTREFETIFWTADILDDEEKSLLGADYDKYLLQYLLIDTLNIREKRILQDIKKLKTTDGGMVFDSVTKNKTTTTTQYTKRDAEGEETPGSSNTVTEDSSSHIAVPVLKRIMELEEALTRVQGKKQRAIEVLHKMEMDDEKLAIDHVKLKLYKQRITGQIDLDELIDNDDFDEDLDIDLD